jgi:hypothetical protein
MTAAGLALRFCPAWAGGDAHRLLERLQAEVVWKEDRIKLFGRTHPLPRLTCWVGDPGCPYTSSGVANTIEA